MWPVSVGLFDYIGWHSTAWRSGICYGLYVDTMNEFTKWNIYPLSLDLVSDRIYQQTIKLSGRAALVCLCDAKWYLQIDCAQPEPDDFGLPRPLEVSIRLLQVLRRLVERPVLDFFGDD